ncbi:uncharacterized protein DS421_4g132720 [Arachis hypogaea]|nr:uncharacterized protein DS421_4g132720 [Arachis hypogaea]
MHSSHPSNALFVKHSLHPSNVTLRSHETGAAVIGVSTGAAKPSLKIGHGGLHCRRNTLSLGSPFPTWFSSPSSVTTAADALVNSDDTVLLSMPVPLPL